MVEIQHKGIIDRMHRDTRIQPVLTLPREFGKVIVPVLQVNPPTRPTIVKFTPTEAELAAGITVPAGVKWKLKSIFFIWTSDVNAGNREIIVILDSSTGGISLFRVASRNFQAASLATNYNFFIGAANVGSSSGETQTIPLPDITLLEGDNIIAKDSASIAVGDTLTLASVIIEEENLIDGEIESR